jgi:CubicO group peptidase (beta-lactamase class C family)
MTEPDALAAFRAKLLADSAADRFSGAALVAKDGKTVFSEAYGLADREKKIPNTLETKFRLGSMNKMFTATAVLQLVQAGKIQLDAPLGNYLPDYPNADIRNKVTIHQLLTHTGGTGDFFSPEYDAHRLEIRTLADYIKLFGSRGPAFEPGSRFEYSNYGFILLGRLIEVTSGEDYYDYVEKHIFLPAGMNSTNSIPEDVAVQNRSIGYMKHGGADWQPNASTLPYRGSSAGGGYSTPGDMLRFAQALTSYKLLNQHFEELLTTGKVDMGPNAKYAYGFGAVTAGGAPWFGHNGGAPGMNGDLRIFPDSGYVIVVLANIDPPAAGLEMNFISTRLPTK